MRPTIVRTAVLLLALWVGSSAQAYQLLGTRWANPATTMFVDVGFEGGTSPSGMSWNEAFLQATQRWSDGTVFAFDVLEEFSHPCAGQDGLVDDGVRNGVGFHPTYCGDSFGSSTLAVTTTLTRRGNTLETDLVFNSRDSWDVYSGRWRADVSDFRRVAVHELGHVLGLGHENTVRAIMSSVILPGDENETPEPDDLAAVAFLYGAPPEEQELEPFVLRLEDPGEGGVKSGVDSLRGWVIASQEVERVDLFIDGEFRSPVPVGAGRGDVLAVFPEYPNAANSGFSLTLNYSNLAPGEHTALVRVVDVEGNTAEASASFTVVRFADSFMADPSSVDLEQADVTLDGAGIHITNLRADGEFYDVTLQWRTSTQSYEIVRIDESTSSSSP